MLKDVKQSTRKTIHTVTALLRVVEALLFLRLRFTDFIPSLIRVYDLL